MVRKPRIAICFFGITRSLTHTIGSIEENILAPARELGEVRIFAHFFQQATIDNPRSGEKGALRQDEHELLPLDWLQLEEPEICLEQHGFEALKAFGDEWGDDFRSLRNLIHQLHSLQQVTEAAVEWAPDVIVFARPDLRYMDSLKDVIQAALTRCDEAIAFIPDWQHATFGLNDRFAVLTPLAAYSYGTRVALMKEFCATRNTALHSESLVRFALMKGSINVSYVPTKAARVRLDGTQVSERYRGRFFYYTKRILSYIFPTRIRKLVRYEVWRDVIPLGKKH